MGAAERTGSQLGRAANGWILQHALSVFPVFSFHRAELDTLGFGQSEKPIDCFANLCYILIDIFESAYSLIVPSFRRGMEKRGVFLQKGRLTFMKSAYFFAGVSIFLWGSTASVTKLLLGGLDSMEILFCVSGLGALFLLVLNLVQGRSSFPAAKSLRGRDWLYMAGIGLLGTFLYHLLLYMAIDTIPAQEAFIINYLWPVMTVLFACILLKERMTVRNAVALLLSFLGVVIVTTKGDLLHMQFHSLKGVAYALAAATCYGLFSVLQKKKGYEPAFSMMIYYLVSFLCAGIFLTARRDLSFLLRLTLPTFAGLVWMGVFTSALAFTCWALALKRGNTAKISNLAFITPFLSLIYIYLLLREEISLYSVAGLAVIVLGILVQMGDRSQGTANAPSPQDSGRKQSAKTS